MSIKMIRNDQDYSNSLATLEGLMSSSPSAGTEEAEQMEVLAFLLEEYEKKRFPVEAPDPIEALRFRMEQANLAPRDLIRYLGSRSKVSEILNGKRPLTLTMIRALHNGLGIPADVLVRESTPNEEEPEVEWERFPLKEMASRGYFRNMPIYSDFSNEALAENPEAVIKAFMAPLGLSTPAALPMLCKKTYQTRSGRRINEHALSAWTLQVLRRAGEVSLPTKYEPSTLTQDFLTKVAQLSAFEQGPLLAKEFLSKHGIALVIEPHLQRTRLDGAAIALWQDKPVIGLTLRHDRIDNFWFCLLHELGHLKLHLSNGQGEFYDDDVDTEADDPREREADEFAGETLVPSTAWRSSPARLAPTPQSVERFANQIHVHPAVVAGRVRHQSKSFRILNNLIGQGQVRRLFPAVTWPDN